MGFHYHSKIIILLKSKNNKKINFQIFFKNILYQDELMKRKLNKTCYTFVILSFLGNCNGK
ncbi:hypothetical protein D9V84_06110 [Bacteroidetes/Chlorobi group bacterium Naka2016]|nr:MAG: hypothetical protein D9V84_06110 [Bacteroidetes/Chlorobi group bacterium Naka2016]